MMIAFEHLFVTQHPKSIYKNCKVFCLFFFLNVFMVKCSESCYIYILLNSIYTDLYTNMFSIRQTLF